METEKKGFWRSLFTPVNVTQASAPQVREDTPTPAYGSSVVASRPYTPAGVSVREAQTLPTVLRAADLISSHVAQLEIGLWRNGVEVDATPLLRNPDPNSTRYDFLQATALSLVLNGNAYWRVYRRDDSDPTSQVLRLEVLSPLTVGIRTDSLNRPTGYTFNNQELKLWNIEHIINMPQESSPYGVGPIQLQQRNLRGALDADEYGSNWFHESKVPNGYYKTDQPLTPELADLYKERIREKAAQNGYEPEVLGNGLSFIPAYLKPADAQFLETRAFNKLEAATFMGVPAFMVNAAVEGSNLTYQNRQDAKADYISDTLMKYLSKIEQAFTRLTPRTQTIRFKTESLLRADYKTQVETVTSAVTAQIMTVDEARTALGLPPKEGGQPDQGSTQTE